MLPRRLIVEWTTRLSRSDWQAMHVRTPGSASRRFFGIGSPILVDVEESLNGNSVSLEQEMIKVSDTQAQFQAATNIYSKAVSMMRTALGKSGP